MDQDLNKQYITKINIFLLKYFNLIVFFIVVSTLFSVSFFFLKPKYDNLVEKESISNQNKEDELIAKTNYKTRLIQYKNHFNEISSIDKKKIDEILPVNFEHKDMLIMFDQLMTENNWLMKSIKISGKVESTPGRNVRAVTRKETVDTKATAADSIGVISVDLMFDPGKSDDYYERSKNILKVFENQLKLMDLENISITFGEGDVLLSINTYYLQ